MAESSNMPSPSGRGLGEGEPTAPKIDLEKLADRVYNLFLADARLGRARGDSVPRPTRMGEG